MCPNEDCYGISVNDQWLALLSNEGLTLTNILTWTTKTLLRRRLAEHCQIQLSSTLLAACTADGKANSQHYVWDIATRQLLFFSHRRWRKSNRVISCRSISFCGDLVLFSMTNERIIAWQSSSNEQHEYRLRSGGPEVISCGTTIAIAELYEWSIYRLANGRLRPSETPSLFGCDFRAYPFPSFSFSLSIA